MTEAQLALIAGVEKLHLQRGDILVARCADQRITEDQAHGTLRHLRRIVAEATGDQNYPIVICVGAMTLECLSEQVIRELGWIKPEEYREHDAAM